MQETCSSVRYGILKIWERTDDVCLLGSCLVQGSHGVNADLPHKVEAGASRLRFPSLCQRAGEVEKLHGQWLSASENLLLEQWLNGSNSTGRFRHDSGTPSHAGEQSLNLWRRNVRREEVNRNPVAIKKKTKRGEHTKRRLNGRRQTRSGPTTKRCKRNDPHPRTSSVKNRNRAWRMHDCVVPVGWDGKTARTSLKAARLARNGADCSGNTEKKRLVVPN